MPADPQPEHIEVRMGHSWANEAMGRDKKIGKIIRRTKTNLTLRQTEAEWEEALDDAIWQVDIESDPSIPAEGRSLNDRRAAERAVRALRAAAPARWLDTFDSATPLSMRHIR